MHNSLDLDFVGVFPPPGPPLLLQGQALFVRAGQTVQFHLRDAKTASDDLHELLRLQRIKMEQVPQGALVFSCNGRGLGLFKEHNHDIRMIQQYLGPVPAAGFFSSGEIGPVAGINFLHGFTNSMVLFYAK